MSAQDITLLTLAVKATATITQYRAVDYSGAPIALADSPDVFGIAKRTGYANEYLDIAVIGTTKLEAGAAITVGQALITDASGRGVPGITNVFGRALQAAAAAGEVIEILLTKK